MGTAVCVCGQAYSEPNSARAVAIDVGFLRWAFRACRQFQNSSASVCAIQMADCSPKKSAIKGVTPMNQFDRGNASPPKTVQAPICPYCGGTSIFLNSSAKIYGGRDYGPVWYCDKDQAWVGCHRGTMSPLGRLANAELRKLKMNVHAV